MSRRAEATAAAAPAPPAPTADGTQLTKAGPPRLPASAKGDISNEENMLWAEEDWTDELEAGLRTDLEAFEVNGRCDMGAGHVRVLENHAASKWQYFYKRNGGRFFKDRHYLDVAFPAVAARCAAHDSLLVEVGCGAGNAVLPLLETWPRLRVAALDFAAAGLELVKQSPHFDPARCTVHRVDAADRECAWPAQATSADFATLLFMLSAVSPARMPAVADRVAAALKPGGLVLLRDYGRFDEAQLRFKKGRRLGEPHFYARQDGTRAYFFNLDDLRALFEAAGFEVLELEYIRRQYQNRASKSVRRRCWVHGVFRRL